MFTFPINRNKKPEPGILGILDKESPAGFLVLVASLKRHPSWFLMLLNELFDDRLYHIHDKKLLEQGKCGLDFSFTSSSLCILRNYGQGLGFKQCNVGR